MKIDIRYDRKRLLALVLYKDKYYMLPADICKVLETKFENKKKEK
jgi:hypothetical protein